MFVSGMNPWFGFFFATSTLIIAVPTAIKVYNWVLTLWRGDIHLSVPMLFTLAFILTFLAGGLTGLFLGNVSVDIPLSGTYFVVAHFHMVMGVAPLLVVFGAIYHWYPKITGRMLDDRLGQFHFWVTFLGTYLIYFPMHYLGVLGMPRRYYNYDGYEFIPPSAHALNAFITVVALFVGVAQLVFVFNLVWSACRGAKRRRQPVARRLARVVHAAHAARSTATGGRSCRWCTAGPTPTACRARRRTSSPQNAPPRRPAARRATQAATLDSSTAAGGGAPGRMNTAALHGRASRPPRRARHRHRAVGVHRRGDRAVRALHRRLRHAHGHAGDWSPIAHAAAAVAEHARCWWPAACCCSARPRRRARASRAGARACCWPAACAAMAFLGSQLWAWQALIDARVVLGGNPAASFFYLLTALHGLHVLGGLVAWSVAAQRVPRGRGRAAPAGAGASRCAHATGTSCWPSGWCCSRRSAG